MHRRPARASVSSPCVCGEQRSAGQRVFGRQAWRTWCTFSCALHGTRRGADRFARHLPSIRRILGSLRLSLGCPARLVSQLLATLLCLRSQDRLRKQRCNLCSGPLGRTWQMVWGSASFDALRLLTSRCRRREALTTSWPFRARFGRECGASARTFCGSCKRRRAEVHAPSSG